MHDAQLKLMHDRITRLETLAARGNPAPTIPSYDSTNFPANAVHGQIAKDQDEALWIYGNDDAWHQVGASANMPWGYAHAVVFGLASSNSITQVDFNPSLSDVTGGTSGDPDITLVANLSGRFSLSLNTPGFYLMASRASFSTGATPSAGSTGLLNSQWLSGALVAGSDIALFSRVLALSNYVAEAGALGIYNANGTGQPVPKSGDTGISQNSGLSATVNVYVFACKISSISKPFTQ